MIISGNCNTELYYTSVWKTIPIEEDISGLTSSFFDLAE
jgi:hypothetical protein